MFLNFPQTPRRPHVTSFCNICVAFMFAWMMAKTIVKHMSYFFLLFFFNIGLTCYKTAGHQAGLTLQMLINPRFWVALRSKRCPLGPCVSCCWAASFWSPEPRMANLRRPHSVGNTIWDVKSAREGGRRRPMDLAHQPRCPYCLLERLTAAFSLLTESNDNFLLRVQVKKTNKHQVLCITWD